MLFILTTKDIHPTTNVLKMSPIENSGSATEYLAAVSDAEEVYVGEREWAVATKNTAKQDAMAVLVAALFPWETLVGELVIADAESVAQAEQGTERGTAAAAVVAAMAAYHTSLAAAEVVYAETMSAANAAMTNAIDVAHRAGLTTAT